MRKNERKHTEKNLKKTGKTEKTNLQNRRESSKLEVLAENGRESPKPYGNFQKRPRCQKTTAISWKRTEPYENGRKCPKADVGV